MRPNTALALLLLGVAGGLRGRQVAGRMEETASLLAAVVVLVIGAGTLVEHALDVDLAIDQFLVRIEGGPHPGRATPPTALALALLASALLLFDNRATARVRPSEWLVLLAGVTAFAGLSGLILGAGPLYRLPRAPLIGMALSTSIGLLLISSGLLLERPRAGLMRVATSPGPGGILLRRLVPPALVAPLLLGLACKQLAAILGIEDPSLVIALLTTTMSVVSVILLTVTAAFLNRTHEALESSRQRTRSLFAEAPDGIFLAISMVVTRTSTTPAATCSAAPARRSSERPSSTSFRPRTPSACGTRSSRCSMARTSSTTGCSAARMEATCLAK